MKLSATYPDISNINKESFIKSVSKRIRKGGYSSIKREDIVLREKMGQLYWLIYSSGEFTFTSYTRITPASIVERGWVASEGSAYMLLESLRSPLCGELLLSSEMDPLGVCSYKLNYRYTLTGADPTYARSICKAKRDTQIKQWENIKYARIPLEQLAKINNANIHFQSVKTPAHSTKHRARQTLDTIIRLGLINDSDYIVWTYAQLADVFRGQDNCTKDMINDIADSMRWLRESGVLCVKANQKTLYSYKLSFTPSFVPAQPMLPPAKTRKKPVIKVPKDAVPAVVVETPQVPQVPKTPVKQKAEPTPIVVLDSVAPPTPITPMLIIEVYKDGTVRVIPQANNQ
jgi:hypothetical protein